MTVLFNTFEGGSDTTTISTGNSGGASGDAFTLSISGAPTFSTTAAYHGLLGMRCADSATQTAAGWGGLNSMTQRASCYVKFGTVPPTNAVQIFQWRTAGNSIIGSVTLNTNSRVIFQHVGGSITAGTNVAGHEIVANNWYRVDCEITIDPTTSENGLIHYSVYDVNAGDTTTPLIEFTGAATLGIVAADAVRFGPMQNLARGGDWLYDTIRAEGGSTIPFSPYLGRTNNAEGGTATDTVTTGNSGGVSGDAWQTVNGSPTFISTPTLIGERAYSFPAANTNVMWTGMGGSQGSMRFAFQLSANTGLSGLRLADVRTGTRSLARVVFNASNQPILQGNNAATSVGSAGTQPAVNTWYICEVVGQSLDAANATVKARIYPANNPSSPILDASSSTISQGTTASVTTFQCGRGAADSYAGSLFIDEIVALNTTTLAYLGNVPIRKTYTFEHGSDGANISTSGATNGDANWDLVVGSGNNDFDTAFAAHGLVSGLVNPTAAQSEMRWTSWLPNTTFSIRFYFRFSEVPSIGDITIAQIRTAAEGQLGHIILSTNGRIIAKRLSGTLIAGTDIAAHAISPNTWYRIDIIWNQNGTLGRLRYRIALASTETDITTPFDSGPTIDLGTTPIGRTYFGPPSSGDRGTVSLWFDSIAVEDGLNDYIGAFPEEALSAIVFSLSKVSSTEVEIDIASWPTDAPDGVTLVRIPGAHTVDGNTNPPSDPDFDPFTISGATLVGEGLDEIDFPYNDSGLTPGEFTYAIARTSV